MVIKSVNLERVCGTTSKLPENQLMEIAFAGKSNVGKSSLINGLMNRKSFARTSSKPGKTQTIDLPGYGYATANVQVKAAWGKLIEDYLYQSKMIKAVFLLVDIRHAPSDNDCMMYDWILEKGHKPVIIATKLDKIKRSQIAGQIKLICDTLEVEDDTIVIPYSALSKQGRDEIYELIDRLYENG